VRTEFSEGVSCISRSQSVRPNVLRAAPESAFCRAQNRLFETIWAVSRECHQKHIKEITNNGILAVALSELLKLSVLGVDLPCLKTGSNGPFGVARKGYQRLKKRSRGERPYSVLSQSRQRFTSTRVRQWAVSDHRRSRPSRDSRVHFLSVVVAAWQDKPASRSHRPSPTADRGFSTCDRRSRHSP
jgi:hypothetical protein